MDCIKVRSEGSSKRVPDMEPGYELVLVAFAGPGKRLGSVAALESAAKRRNRAAILEFLPLLGNCCPNHILSRHRYFVAKRTIKNVFSVTVISILFVFNVFSGCDSSIQVSNKPG